MSTSNFDFRNSRKVYTVEIEDEYQHEDLVFNLQDAFAEYFKDFVPNLPPVSEQHENRNYYGISIGEIRSSADFGRETVSIEMEIIIRNGYYSGVNLDWSIRYNTGSEWMDELPEEHEIAEDFAYHQDHNAGLCKIFAAKAYKWITEQKEKMIVNAEAIFAKYSMPLKLVCVASNGEAFYRKAHHKARASVVEPIIM